MLDYVDNVVILSETQVGLEKLSTKFMEISKQAGLRVYIK